MPTPDYWQKNDDPKSPLFADLAWNIPDQKSGKITVVGGNSQTFAAPVKVSDYLAQTFPLQEVTTLLPDSLAKSLPPLDNFQFAPSTKSGSFAESDLLSNSTKSSDGTLLIGDLSKNTATAKAIIKLIQKATSPLFITRDTIDLITSHAQDVIESTQTYYIASLTQLQKLFRSLYYPKMIILSMPLLQLVETLHKFTLTYPCTIMTFHEGKILVASAGKVTSTPIDNTKYTPLRLWSGILSANITAFNLYNPDQPLPATTAALCY